MADGEEGEEGGEGEEGEKRLVDLRRSSLMASPQVKINLVMYLSGYESNIFVRKYEILR